MKVHPENIDNIEMSTCIKVRFLERYSGCFKFLVFLLLIIIIILIIVFQT